MRTASRTREQTVLQTKEQDDHNYTRIKTPDVNGELPVGDRPTIPVPTRGIFPVPAPAKAIEGRYIPISIPCGELDPDGDPRTQIHVQELEKEAGGGGATHDPSLSLFYGRDATSVAVDGQELAEVRVGDARSTAPHDSRGRGHGDAGAAGVLVWIKLGLAGDTWYLHSLLVGPTDGLGPSHLHYVNY